MALQIFYIAQLVILISFCGYLTLYHPGGGGGFKSPPPPIFCSHAFNCGATLFRHVNKKKKKSENFLCSLPRLAKPVKHVSWGFFGILDVLRVVVVVVDPLLPDYWGESASVI